jgi:hypothetical protein
MSSLFRYSFDVPPRDGYVYGPDVVAIGGVAAALRAQVVTVSQGI